MIESPSHGWTPVWAMPNLTLDEAIDGSRVALAPSHDPRVIELLKRYPIFKTYLRSFRDEFGTKVSPTIGLVRQDASSSVQTVTAFGGFRDAVCFSAVVAGRGLKLTSGSTPMGIVHSEAFDVYPWFPTPKMDGRLHVLTPALGGSHLVERLRPTPALGSRSLAVSQIDGPLLGAIVSRWERCFANGNESTEDRRLFRALEMARAASKTPGGADASEHDAGRVSALWVSAFEILAHDGHRSDFRRILSLLNHVQWLNQKLEIKDRTVGKDKQISTNLAGAVYDRLYMARNHFLHGDPVTAQTLMLEKRRMHVHLFAASLFRLALTAFLDVYPPKMVTDAAGEDIGRQAAEGIAYRQHQKLAERAILAADETPKTSPLVR